MTITQGMHMSTNGTTPTQDFTPATISENALVVLDKRYLQKNVDGDIVESGLSW